MLWSVGVIVYIVVWCGLWVLLFTLWCVVVCGCYCLHCGVLWSVGVIVYIVVCCGVKRNSGDVFM